MELLNLVSGERRTVTAGANEILACAPVWCRVTTIIEEGQSIIFDVQRTEGGDRRRIGDGSLTPLNIDVALLDRFEVLASVLSANATLSSQRLWLYDVTADRTVLLADGTTGTIGSRGGFPWWSTGDNETLEWRVLDLRQLS